MTSAYKKRPTVRKSHHRDAKLIVIATEGTKTEKKYFEDLVSNDWYGNSSVQVEIITGENTDRSPKKVFAEIDTFKKKYRLDKSDELWIVIDVDKWSQDELSEVARLCNQKKYFLGVSNPCFEIWLLLHLTTLKGYPPSDLLALLENPKVNKNRSRLEYEILNILGSYNKSNLDTTSFLPHVYEAIERAVGLDKDTTERWPSSLGSRVYVLVQNILSKKK